jgi:hypothetical protein
MLCISWSNKRFSPIPFYSKAVLWQIYADSNNEFHSHCWSTHCHQLKYWTYYHRNTTMHSFYYCCWLKKHFTLYLHGHPSRLIPFHWKMVILQKIYITHSNKIHLGVHIKYLTFLPDCKQIWILLTDFGKSPMTNFMSRADRYGQMNMIKNNS